MNQINTMTDAATDQLDKSIDACMLADRFRFKKKLRDLIRLGGKLAYENKIKALALSVEKSLALVERREQQVPVTRYPEALPISQKRDKIAEAILKHQVVIIAGETGSGKTTQIPKICLDIGRGIVGKIGHTQPRRLAARTVAARLAEELNVSLGEQVGFQIRFSDQSSQKTLIKLMTDGILLAETQQDRFLNAYDTIIIDEAHERSLNIDFLLGYLKQLLPRRPELKVIITSATIDLERFSKHFSNAPIIEVSGRTYPVEVIYQPATELADKNKNTDSRSSSGADMADGLAANVIAAVDRIRAFPRRNGPDDILIFLSGEKDIRDISKVLKQQQYRHTEILPLYGRLSNAEQNKVFQSHTGQRIILATNVAETSVTVPGIRYVIDPGLARISRYSVRSKVQQLPIEPISQASANQRKGRCGRVSDGVCVRLYSEEDFNNRPEFTGPEISRTNLASVILSMLNLRLGSIDAFPFLDKPHSRSIKDGYQLLLELGAVDQRRTITGMGRQLARFPLDPRIARMVIAAAEQDCVKEVIIIAAALAIQDPRERPHSSRQLADEKHRVFADPDSDFISLVNLWNEVEAQRQALTRNQFSKYCKRHFLSYLRVEEWRATHRQLLLLCRELSFRLNQQPADYSAIHRSILSGLLGYIGEKQEKNEYQGTRNRRFHIFPGSNLFKKTPKWIVAFELVETTRLYARMAARIDPAWVEPLAKTLVKKQYSEPHWQKKRGQVVAFEQVSLYGLVVVSRRAVDYGRIDPQQAREIFIQSALVEGLLETRFDFFKRNQQLITDIGALEEKSRRRDILVDDDSIFRFYDDRIPELVCSSSTLAKWLKKSKSDHRLLLTRDYLMQHCATQVNVEQFPDVWQHGETPLRLTYEFSPGRDDDGVSLEVPLALLNQISAKRLQWLVPGMLRDKCIALVKALPKATRKNFVPVPGFVDQALAELDPGDQSLTNCLGRALKRLTGIEIAAKQWDVSALDNFHLMNIRVIDDKGTVLGQGRNLVTLRKKLGQNIEACMTRVNRSAIERANITCWDFGSLEHAIDVEQGGISLKAYPAVVEKAGHISIELADNKAKARGLSQRGILRLLMLATPDQHKYISRQIAASAQTLLYFARLGSRNELIEDCLRAIYQRTFLDDHKLPMNKAEFDRLIKTRKQDLISLANDTLGQVTEILRLRHKISASVAGHNAIASVFVYSDIQHQLDNLFEAGFIYRVPWRHLKNFPRYLKAVQLRIDKIQGQLQREKTYCEQLQQFWQQYEGLKKQYQNQALSDEMLTRLRWLFEEYRVSLYAQVLGTSEPVSKKRLEKLFSQLEI